ncbi:MAG: insulinase family protein, partial [Alloprevotella tannerae]|nr:insulinase family protein [Alloprevotella tannerae]
METLEKADYERIQAIYRQLFCGMNDCNVILVGNIDLQSLRPLLCRYVASLPAKNSVNSQRTAALPAVRKVDETLIYRRRQDTPYASVSIFYDFELPYEPKSDVMLKTFKLILQMMYTDTIREESGGAYHVSVNTELDGLKTPNALLKIAFRTDPQRYEELIPLVYEQLLRLAEHGPTQELLQKSKEFLLKAYRQQARSNHYWLHILYNMVYRRVDFDTDYEKTTEAVSAHDVQQLCAEIIAQKRRIEITMLPL